jgi:hypothetical protein
MHISWVSICLPHISGRHITRYQYTSHSTCLHHIMWYYNWWRESGGLDRCIKICQLTKKLLFGLLYRQTLIMEAKTNTKQDSCWWDLHQFTNHGSDTGTTALMQSLEGINSTSDVQAREFCKTTNKDNLFFKWKPAWTSKYSNTKKRTFSNLFGAMHVKKKALTIRTHN